MLTQLIYFLIYVAVVGVVAAIVDYFVSKAAGVPYGYPASTMPSRIVWAVAALVVIIIALKMFAGVAT